jgi:hypothetical protein
MWKEAAVAYFDELLKLSSMDRGKSRQVLISDGGLWT